MRLDERFIEIQMTKDYNYLVLLSYIPFKASEKDLTRTSLVEITLIQVDKRLHTKLRMLDIYKENMAITYNEGQKSKDYAFYDICDASRFLDSNKKYPVISLISTKLPCFLTLFISNHKLVVCTARKNFKLENGVFAVDFQKRRGLNYLMYLNDGRVLMINPMKK